MPARPVLRSVELDGPPTGALQLPLTISTMKITFVTANVDLSGGCRVIADYAQGLSRRGHEVSVVTRPYPEADLRTKIRTLVKEGRWPRQPRRPRSHFDGR